MSYFGKSYVHETEESGPIFFTCQRCLPNAARQKQKQNNFFFKALKHRYFTERERETGRNREGDREKDREKEREREILELI